MQDKDKLSERQKAFADHYLMSLNATASYKLAGYASKGNAAEVSASQLLRNAKVRKYIEKRQAKLQEKLEITQERILAEYAKLAFLDPRLFYDETGNLIPVHELPEAVSATLSGMSVESVPGGSTRLTKIKFSDKQKALDSLARIQGMFKDTVKVEVVSYQDKLQKARERANRSR